MPELPSLGPRGEGWFAVQLLLMTAIVAALFTGPRWPDVATAPLGASGAVLAVAGGAFAYVAARLLGRSLSPYPRPRREAELVERGPYRVVRHPIYAGAVLFFAGLSLAFSPIALVFTVALAVAWGLKARVEERFLRASFPEYTAYAKRTRYRLLPFVY